MTKPVGESIAALEAHVGHLVKDSAHIKATMRDDNAEIKSTMRKLFDLSDRTLKAVGQIDTSNQVQDQLIDDHVSDVEAHHRPPCKSVEALGASNVAAHMANTSLHHHAPCDFAKTTSNRGWGLLIVVIGALLTALAAYALAALG